MARIVCGRRFVEGYLYSGGDMVFFFECFIANFFLKAAKKRINTRKSYELVHVKNSYYTGIFIEKFIGR